MKTPFGKVQPAIAFAARNLDREIPLEALAASAALSPFHMHRVFAAVTNETPKQYTLRLRLGRAAALLLTRRESIFRIALACGFESHEGFTRAFKRQFGMTPSAYRARGFASEASDEQAAAHERLVDRVGPCVGLFHYREDRTRARITMDYTITKKEIQPEPVLVARRRVPMAEISATIGDVVSRLFEYAQAEGLVLTGYPFTRYLDVGPGLMTLEPGMRVAPSGETDWPGQSGSVGDPDDGEVRRDSLPGGLVASTIHAGPYDRLSAAYAALERWMAAEGVTPAGPPWEAYLNSPADSPDPMDWKTEVFWPIR